MKYCYFILPFFLLLTPFLSAQCPDIGACPTGVQDVCDLTSNNADLWNESYWLDILTQSNNLPDAPVELNISATDACTGTLSLRCLLFLDLDGNGSMETVINSDSMAGYTSGTVPFDNSANPNYGGGTPRNFDQRPLPIGQKYRFALETSGDGTSRTAWLRWSTTDAPGAFINPELPYGAHKIRWIAANTAGGQDSCEYTFIVRDCKKPTVVCINGIPVNIMPTGVITLWDTDFLQYTEDNHTPDNQLILGIRKAGTGAGFPIDSLGNPTHSVTFNCAELGAQIVELWAIDRSGNADYCETFALVQDAGGICQGPNNPVNIQVCVKQWCTDAPVSGCILSITGSHPALPPHNLFLPDTLPYDASGCLLLGPLTTFPYPADYTLTPVKEDDPLNGVDVFDLIRMNLHILGIEPIASPYGQIAADANKSGSITTFDVVETRKVMLGHYVEFPNNTSWRFIDADYMFPNPGNPFQQAFPEVKSLGNLQDTVITITADFVAVKIGDIDCTAIPGFTGASEHRYAAALTTSDALLQADETIDLPVYPSENDAWIGLQFGLAFDPERLSVEAVLPGSLPNWDDYTTAQPRPGLLNAVWYDVRPNAVQADQPLFTLRLKARKPVQLSEVLQLSAGNLYPRAYTGDLLPVNLQWRFLPAGIHTSGIGNPAPNPTAAGAVLPLQIAGNTAVQLSVWDMQGRLTWQQNTVAGAGMKQLLLPAEAFPAAGMYVWRVLAGGVEKSGKIGRQ